MEKNGQQVVIHHETIRDAQKLCHPDFKADLWQWICNPTAKTYQFILTRPTINKNTTMAAAVADMWEKLEAEQAKRLAELET